MGERPSSASGGSDDALSQSDHRSHRLIDGLAVSLITILVMVLVCELGLRLIFHHSLDFGLEMWKYAVALKRPVNDPKLGFAHAPSRHAFLMGVDVDINSQGQRDDEYSIAKPPGVYRVLHLGDSTTFGWGVSHDDMVAKILEKKLNEAKISGYQQIEVINCGVGNYNTVQEVEYYLTRGRAFKPDLVILEYFINDAEPVPHEGKGLLIDRSYLVNFAISRLDGVMRIAGKRPDWRQYYASLYGDDRPGWIAAQQAMRDLAEGTKQDGAKLLVAILPELHEINQRYPFTLIHHKVRGVFESLSVPVIDLLDGLRNQGPESALWVTLGDAHPNGRANRLIATQMSTWILAQFQAMNAVNRKTALRTPP